MKQNRSTNLEVQIVSMTCISCWIQIIQSIFFNLVIRKIIVPSTWKPQRALDGVDSRVHLVAQIYGEIDFQEHLMNTTTDWHSSFLLSPSPRLKIKLRVERLSFYLSWQRKDWTIVLKRLDHLY